MGFEPQKFFIGLMDFFSILLPGALLTYLLKEDLGQRLFGVRYHGLTGPEAWLVFLFSAYLLGHFIFLVGSWLLDDRMYDPLRKATYEAQVRELADGKRLSPAFTRWLAAFVFKRNVDEAVRRAARVKDHYLDPINAKNAINTFQWCKARLSLEKPEAMAAVQRFEADSKFFRSLVIVLAVLLPWSLIDDRPGVALVSVVLLALALWRYKDQRVKATNQAYWYILTLESQRDGGFRHVAPASGPTHAGGVVRRGEGNQRLYLLVQASDDPKVLVLPKGHIERGEPAGEAAVREVREETGVWARVARELKTIAYEIDDKPVRVQFYLMEFLRQEKPRERREHVWLPFKEAVAQAEHDSSKALLRLADEKRAAKTASVPRRTD